MNAELEPVKARGGGDDDLAGPARADTRRHNREWANIAAAARGIAYRLTDGPVPVGY